MLILWLTEFCPGCDVLPTPIPSIARAVGVFASDVVHVLCGSILPWVPVLNLCLLVLALGMLVHGQHRMNGK